MSIEKISEDAVRVVSEITQEVKRDYLEQRKLDLIEIKKGIDTQINWIDGVLSLFTKVD